MSYEEFFRRATGGNAPYPWQHEMAAGPWPDIVDVPTGLGKTAGIAIAWMYRRRTQPGATPMRLVYCLPMRTLVEQTAGAIEEWVANLGIDLRVFKVMGGDVDDSWVDDPNLPAVIIGTQDMLLSRALNRGYGMNRARWPVHFAFLNNDAAWVFDEIQLMGVGVETSAQLHGFRQLLATERGCWSTWMSATVGRQQLDTVDHRDDGQWSTRPLTAADRDHERVVKRLTAEKSIQPSDIVLGAKRDDAYPSAVASRASELHTTGTLTLIIVNRVKRAIDVYMALLDTGRTTENTLLVHGRFRPHERRLQLERLNKKGTDQIIVATQVVEAGLDISATAMITELAPWPSLVQRIGRCNRDGETRGVIEWINADTETDKNEGVLPYSAAALDQARTLITVQTDGSPAALGAVAYESEFVVRPVVRRRDLLQLFDTTSDITGTDLDVSRWVRDDSEPDLSLYWRIIGEKGPAADAPRAQHNELCRVSIAQGAGFVKKHGAWTFDYLDRKWRRVTRARPGQLLLLDVNSGGYSNELGFTGDKKHKPTIPPLKGEPERAFDDDRLSDGAKQWMTVTQHLCDVADEAANLADELELSDEWKRRITLAARWHDVGKAHHEFQRRLIEPTENSEKYAGPPSDGLWAKSNHNVHAERNDRRYFRHELASALLFMAQYEEPDADLVAYLILAHHGKLRLVIRRMPEEKARQEDGTTPKFYAAGVWHRDPMPEVDLGDGTFSRATTLDLSLMELGEGSWRERTLGLVEQFGPFRLAWWESLVRVADWRGSRKGRENG